MMKTSPMRYLQLILILIFLAGCQATTKVTTAKYEEDLSVYRETSKPVTTIDEEEEETDEIKEVIVEVNDDVLINQEIDYLIDTINQLSQKNKYILGYTVQVYNGRNREEAFKAKELVYQLTSDEDPEVVYRQPNFKVKVGKYLERIEATRMQSLLRREFKNPIVIPERIYFN